jgi:hypothetical protein
VSHEKPRVETRTKALIRARLRDGGLERDACILDVSTRGVLATTAMPPPRGEFVELAVGRHKLVGHVKWSGQRRFGLALRERISVAALVSGDSSSIALKQAQSARKRSGSLLEALAGNSRDMGRFVQLGIVAAIAIGAAWLLAGYVSSGMSSFGDARMAMSRGALD